MDEEGIRDFCVSLSLASQLVLALALFLKLL